MIRTIIHTAAEAIGWIFIAMMALAWLGNKLDQWENKIKKP